VVNVVTNDAIFGIFEMFTMNLKGISFENVKTSKIYPLYHAVRSVGSY
jgi:hypothetical protein